MLYACNKFLGTGYYIQKSAKCKLNRSLLKVRSVENLFKYGNLMKSS